MKTWLTAFGLVFALLLGGCGADEPAVPEVEVPGPDTDATDGNPPDEDDLEDYEDMEDSEEGD
ncbi:hypothetical protein [Planococcus salinus]|uniref:DNA primase n=1 Tax=Planococcus salinus TaxID=1848460 RepID=A0A3M8P3X3_9BACL|nr:hypothetical protein [Planococcus salinus]RNF38365.1 hypothetical protein EEX84_14700 [Planococcus salinus]